MPTYEYKCRECNVHFEIVRSISETSTVMCDSCGTASERVYSVPGISFNGSGFYVTDNRK
jgi:putative FmdB family regulatory protein